MERAQGTFAFERAARTGVEIIPGMNTSGCIFVCPAAASRSPGCMVRARALPLFVAYVRCINDSTYAADGSSTSATYGSMNSSPYRVSNKHVVRR